MADGGSLEKNSGPHAGDQSTIALAALTWANVLLHVLLDERPNTLVLDFAGVPFCDSSGIGVLVRLYNRATVIGCRLVVRRPTVNVRGVLDMTSLTRVLRIDGDQPDASTTT